MKTIFTAKERLSSMVDEQAPNRDRLSAYILDPQTMIFILPSVFGLLVGIPYDGNCAMIARISQTEDTLFADVTDFREPLDIPPFQWNTLLTFKDSDEKLAFVDHTLVRMLANSYGEKEPQRVTEVVEQYLVDYYHSAIIRAACQIPENPILIL